MDMETGHGLVSDVCIKRKIRNYISLVKSDSEGQPSAGYDIYIKERSILNLQHARAYAALDIDPKARRDKGDEIADELRARAWMCQEFFDVRMFGAVMATDVNAGQVRGPVQIAFSRSIDPISPVEHSISRMAVTTEKEATEQGGRNQMMGRRHAVPYGLYRCHGFINPYLAAQTGFSEDDLTLLWQALEKMFELDRSASRGEMATQKLLVFEHSSPLGSAPAHKLFQKIEIRKKITGVPPRGFSDYEVIVPIDWPKGIILHERV
jgi:CRISPR-associated protein Csd2